ncbi:hypothetical protein QFZ82_005233 [Streptomyces sp. V4I23]|nr:hypothetical protein [Streptomyces sp. V4I23]
MNTTTGGRLRETLAGPGRTGPATGYDAAWAWARDRR